MDRCKFKSKIFENIVFTLESIYFVSFQYKERNIISLYSKEIVFLLFLFFFSRVFSRDSLEKKYLLFSFSFFLLHSLFLSLFLSPRDAIVSTLQKHARVRGEQRVLIDIDTCNDNLFAYCVTTRYMDKDGKR